MVIYNVVGLLLLLLLAGPGECRTLSQLRSDARMLAKDSVGTRPRFSDAQVNALLNEGQRLVAVRTRCFRRSTDFQLALNTTYYALPSDYMDMVRVTRQNLVLDEVSPGGLDGKSRGWEASRGTPNYYFINFSSRNRVGFAPYPGTSVDTGTVKMEYYYYPGDMTVDSNVPFNNDSHFLAYHHAPAYYAAGMMTLLEGRESVGAAYLGMFEGMLKSMSETCVLRPNFNPQATGRQ